MPFWVSGGRAWHLPAGLEEAAGTYLWSLSWQQ